MTQRASERCIHLHRLHHALSLSLPTSRQVDLFALANEITIPKIALNKTGHAPDPPTDAKKAIYLNPPGPKRGILDPPYIEKPEAFRPEEGHQ